MYNHGTETDAVITIDDLLAKMDMLLSAAQRPVTNDDNDLGYTLNLRAAEVFDLLPRIHGTSEQWDVVASKAEAVNNAMRQREINQLNAAFALQ